MRVTEFSCFVFLIFCALLFDGCTGSKAPVVTENHFDSLELAGFVEPDFPFITTSLDARNIGSAFPETNTVARGLAVQLGDSAYMCFDMDLLRWSVAWSGNFMPMVLPAQISYNEFFGRNHNEIPTVSGQPTMATGIYAGWSVGVPVFRDVRPESQRAQGMGWGPVSESLGHWRGIYLYNDLVLLSYRIGAAEVEELPGAIRSPLGTIFTRTFRVGPSAEEMHLHVAEVTDGKMAVDGGTYGYVIQGEHRDSVTAVALTGAGHGAVHVFDDRYLTVAVPPADSPREFTVSIWKGVATDRQAFEEQQAGYSREIPDYRNGAPSRWETPIATQAQVSPDTAAFVTDILTLPLPNPWARNVRVGDIAFFADGRAAVSTYEGDVWMVSGIDDGLGRMNWRRYASGLYEPMSIEVIGDDVFVYAKEGIVRLLDLNGDGEADYYENFSNKMNQSTGTREWASDMVADKEGNFYIAKGGNLTGTNDRLPNFMLHGKKTGYGAGSVHTGTIMKISANGEKADVVATGFRVPYIGLNRTTGFLTASDQQGNYVPATPIYQVNWGSYYGVPITAHQDEEPAISDPITWIPHRVDRSAISQAWVDSKTMGPLNGQMVHFSFGRPGMFRVLLDSTDGVLRGGVTPINTYYPAPVMKGEVRPTDGMLYVAGFNNFASSSLGISALIRLRYTGKPSYMLSDFRAGKEGIVLSFDSALDEQAAVDVGNYRVKRWNYRRTKQYGSGHFGSDGVPGEEVQPVLAAYLSTDRKQVLLLVPDMKAVDQVEVLYDLVAQDGKRFEDGIWFSLLHHIEPLVFNNVDFGNVDYSKLNLSQDEIDAMIKADLPVTVDRGRSLFAKTGCLGCHSTEGRTEGMYGPPFQNLFGSKVELEGGSVVTVDEAYLKESILEPSKKVVKGYHPEMPSYQGVLSDSDLQSIILYIKTLALVPNSHL